MQSPKPALVLTRRVEQEQVAPQSIRYRFFCDGCDDPFESEPRPPSLTENDEREATLADLQGFFRFCPGCQGWVCRVQCWEPIQGMCEPCATQNTPLRPAMSGEANPLQGGQLFSSILGTVCPQCKMVLHSEASSCPECGHGALD